MNRRIQLLSLLVTLACALMLAALPVSAQPPLPRGGTGGIPYALPSDLIQPRAAAYYSVTVSTDPAVVSCDYSDGMTLREAVVICGATTVYVPNGTYTLATAIAVTAADSITIVGQDRDLTIIQGAASLGASTHRLFDIGLQSANLTFSNLTLRFGKATSSGSGGALRYEALTGGFDYWIRFYNANVLSNSADLNGGAVAQTSASSAYSINLSIENSTFQSNTADAGGAITFVDLDNGSLTVTNSKFKSNQTACTTFQTGGGALNVQLVDGSMNISDSEFTQNASLCSGGALTIQGAGGANFEATVGDSTFTGNSTGAGKFGGAIYHLADGTADTILTLDDSTFTTNSAGDGGAVWTEGRALQVSESHFTGNSASAVTGGAIYHNTSAGYLSVSGSSFEANTSLGSAGGLFVTGETQVTIDNSSFIGNQAQNEGGGLEVFVDSTLTLSNTLIANNRSVTSYGGGLFLAVDLATLDNVQIVGNRASGVGGKGGGLYTHNLYDGIVILQNTLIESNFAATGPDCHTISATPYQIYGGVWLGSSAGCTLYNLTILTPALGSSVIDNLIVNPGFELPLNYDTATPKENLPHAWTAKFITSDKRQCNSAALTILTHGRCAMVFKGAAGEKSQLSQILNVGALANLETVTLNAQGSGTGAKLTITATLKYSTGASAKLIAKFTGSTSGQIITKTATDMVNGTLTSVDIKIVNTATKGKFALDRVYLTGSIPAVRFTRGASDVLPPPTAPGGFRGNN